MPDTAQTKWAKPTWTSFENATKEDFLAVMEYDEAYANAVVDRLLVALKELDEEDTPYPINRYQHSLQSATRAREAGEPEDLVVAALIHDLGDTLSPFNHGELAAAIVKPYVSERTHWILKHHCVFQGYYYNHHLGGDRHAREKYKDSPHYDACVKFCHEYDQASFDPDYPTKPLAFFEPMLRRVFSQTDGHMELNETREG
ncbi:HD domain-containing protein [Aliiroseovarius sp. KMU-50]|uniref:HD domain-containing protein n=1 Tax=Aliiroseovarius salicola TaxID=3009082 RepID=A0ABT4VWU4_9RHOB|nr:HD domain-containing protein [Aliiroseovarius sp. KMU-50]MDA5092715.1 HD domain-containing protein [Aliiroseovarius sp. KMU-50]